MMRLPIVLLVVWSSLLCALGTASAAPYVLTVLGEGITLSSLSSDWNASGQRASGIMGPDEHWHAALEDASGKLTDLGTLGGSDSWGRGINNSAEVVGWSALAGDRYDHAFLYSNGTMTDLGTLGGSESWAWDINDGGQIVGSSRIAGDQHTRAFLYSNGTMADLGTLGGAYTESLAISINNGGEIVGTCESYGGPDHCPFLYSQGAMIDLNSVIGDGYRPVLDGVVNINDSGQIIAWGHTYIDWDLPAYYTYLMTPAAAGDANLDGAVDIADLAKTLTNYDKAGMTWSEGDFDGNGTVDIGDLNKLLTGYDKGIGSSAAGIKAVPEPSSLALLTASLLVMGWPRGRRLRNRPGVRAKLLQLL